MRAIRCVSYGEPKELVLDTIEPPAPGADEVVVAVEAVGLGYVDALHVRGGYQIKKPLPFVPGSEIAGHVVEVGPGASPQMKGQRVMAMSPDGALAERVRLPVSACIPLPERLSSEAAAGFLVSYCTGLYGLEDCGALKPGETVLVLGASGGVGEAAIDIAKAMGARVIAAASSAEKLEACLARGADLTVDYSRDDWRQTLQRLAGEKGINMVYDPVGGRYSETAFRCLSPGGRFLVVGFANGEIPRIPLNLPLLKRSAIVGVDWGGHVRADPKANVPLLARLVDWIEAGRISPRASSVHPLEEAPAVLQALLDRRSIGKPVIRL